MFPHSPCSLVVSYDASWYLKNLGWLNSYSEFQAPLEKNSLFQQQRLLLEVTISAGTDRLSLQPFFFFCVYFFPHSSISVNNSTP